MSTKPIIPYEYLMGRNLAPQGLCVEIEKHEAFLALVEAGLTRCSKRRLDKHKKYVTELKAQLFQMTEPGLNSPTTDEQLLELLEV